MTPMPGVVGRHCSVKTFADQQKQETAEVQCGTLTFGVVQVSYPLAVDINALLFRVELPAILLACSNDRVNTSFEHIQRMQCNQMLNTREQLTLILHCTCSSLPLVTASNATSKAAFSSASYRQGGA